MLDEVKLYLRVNGDLEDELISGMIDAAVEYLKSASGKNKTAAGRPIEESPLFITAVKMMVAHWYDNRGVEYTGGIQVTDIGYSVKLILGHITTSTEYIHDDAD